MRLALVFVLATLAITACSDGDSPFCAAARELADEVGATDSLKIRELVQELADAAPDELRTAGEEVAEDFDEIDKILASVGYDLEKATREQLTALEAASQRAQTHSETVDAYIEANCRA